jgi:IclR family acetate operon transcriptional repressor
MVVHILKQETMAPAETARVTHQSLERGIRLLEVVASTGCVISLAEISRRAGLHRSTTHHLLQTMVGLGYLRQDPISRGYELAAKVFQLTGRTWTPDQLGNLAEPFIADLTRQTGPGSSVAVCRDGFVRIVAKRDSDGPVRVVQNIGAERPIHATAVGKAIVAFLSPRELSGILDRLNFERFTSRTIVSRPAFEAELRRIRSAGVATDDEEHSEGIRCLAAPFFSYNGQVAGCVCTVGPKSRMTRQRLRDLRMPVLECARALSERLGWTQGESAVRRMA